MFRFTTGFKGEGTDDLFLKYTGQMCRTWKWSWLSSNAQRWVLQRPNRWPQWRSCQKMELFACLFAFNQKLCDSYLELNEIELHIYWKDFLILLYNYWYCFMNVSNWHLIIKILAKSWWLWDIWDLKCCYSEYKLIICILCNLNFGVFLNWPQILFALHFSPPAHVHYIENVPSDTTVLWYSGEFIY